MPPQNVLLKTKGWNIVALVKFYANYEIALITPYMFPNLFCCQNLRDQVISSQPTDKRGAMMTWFENLMDGIERNLLTKNRDRFTQNLSVFRR